MTSVFAEGPSLLKLALGKGKTARQLYGLTTLDAVVRELQSLPKEISLKYQMPALRRAAKPGQDALRRNVAQLTEVTGNLLASVTRVDRKYTNNKANIPVGVVVVGFRRPVNAKSQKMATPAFSGGSVLKGPNRAYHSHLVEYGTRPRVPGIKSVTKSRRRVVLGGRIRTLYERESRSTGKRILSSFNTRGAFSYSASMYSGGRGEYPKDFIATGQVRGATARRPLTKAFQQSRGQMQSVLDTEMRKALTRAMRAYQRKYGDLG